MWKRLNNARGARQPVVQEPRELYSGEGDDLGVKGHYRGMDTGGAYGNHTGVPEKLRREDDMAPKSLPRLPFEAGYEKQDSTLRPASSLYSQPSPNPILTGLHQNPYQIPYTEEEEVSPESSPELRPLNYRSQSPEDRGVSPIDEMPDVAHFSLVRPESMSNPPSSIPTLRKEKRNQVAAAAANLVGRKNVGDNPRGRTAHDPRWDPYSGEITTSDRGRPQSVKPGTFSVPGLRPVHKETGLPLGNESSITTAATKQHTSFGDRVRRLKGNNTVPVPVERPGWKGATGRVTLVPPVLDQLDMPPISIPRKSSKRVVSPKSETFSGGNSPVTLVRKREGETSPASATHPSSMQTVVNTGSGETDTSRIDKPQSPVTINPDPVVVSQSAAATTLARNANTSPTESPGHQAPERWDRDDGTMANIERNFREQLQMVSTPIHEEPEPEYVQPSSRFSVTTYAPSTAHTTPRPSNDTFSSHPMPTPPADPSFLLNRQRPRLSESPKANSVVSRKPIPALSSPVFISMSSVPAHLPLNKRSSNIAKNLPLSPAEAESHDLVTSLQAQLENLAHRRNNIVRSIRQMTELMPKDSIMLNEDVRRKREAEKRKVEQLRSEESDVRREEHEIGLRLHRAYKRRDKDAVFEPTGLWVRRVTG